MIAADLLRDLQRRGITVIADGDCLDIEGPFTDADLEQIRKHKPELLRLLAGPTPIDRPIAIDPRYDRDWFPPPPTVRGVVPDRTNRKPGCCHGLQHVWRSVHGDICGLCLPCRDPTTKVDGSS